MPRKILLADDEEPLRALVAATVGGDPRYELFEAKDGVETLDIARREKPELVLLDIRMPRMDGLEVCRRLKSDVDTSGIRVVMLTALAQDKDKDRAKEAGADGYFTKPFSPTALIAKVEELLGD